MAFSVVMGLPEGKNPEDDALFRQQRDSARRVDKKDDFEYETVGIGGGVLDATTKKKTRHEVVIKFALDGWYAFATLNDNLEAFKDAEREIWMACANNALEKFAAMHGLSVKMGPRPEDHNRYNAMIEVNKPIKMKPETLAAFEQARKDREELEAVLIEEERRAAVLRKAGQAA